jgi:hypothetical protein
MTDKKFQTPPTILSLMVGGGGGGGPIWWYFQAGPILTWHKSMMSDPPHSKPVTAYPPLRYTTIPDFLYHRRLMTSHSTSSLSRDVTFHYHLSLVISHYSVSVPHPPFTHHMSFSPTHYPPRHPHTPLTHHWPVASFPDIRWKINTG